MSSRCHSLPSRENVFGFRYFDISIFGCFNIWMFRYLDVSIFRYFNILKYRNSVRSRKKLAGVEPGTFRSAAHAIIPFRSISLRCTKARLSTKGSFELSGIKYVGILLPYVRTCVCRYWPCLSNSSLKL
jgi:hypothetical protein